MAECNVMLSVHDGTTLRVARCFACGNAVCLQCSEIVKAYNNRRRVRICNDCMTDHADSITRYPEGRPERNEQLTHPEASSA